MEVRQTMADFRICDECGERMLPETTEQKFHFNGKDIIIKGLNVYKCQNCENIVYTSDEAKMIERLIQAFDSKPAVDILNLEETAKYLRVSNQTIYNMIRDGRIKAYKVGREWRLLRTDIRAYLEESSNNTAYKIAAKGGQITEHDKAIICEEIKKRNND